METLRKIETELTRLDKTQWIGAIKKLRMNFSGYPFDDESQTPAAAIYEILKKLHKDDNPEERFIFDVQSMDCFTFRAYYQEKNETIYFNPLRDQFLEFKKHDTVDYQADKESPAPDIIRKWLYHEINRH